MTNELKTIDDLSEQLMNESNPAQLENIIDLFNVSFQKKNILRIQKLNELQDKIQTQIEKRLDNKIDEFSNKDLIDYFKVMQDSIIKNSDNAEMQNAKVIQIIQNQTNVQNNLQESEPLSRESKEKISEAVQSMLSKLNLDNNKLSTENIQENTNE